MTKRASSSRRRSSSRKTPPPTLWSRLSTDQKLDIVGWALFLSALFTFLSLISARQGVFTEWWVSTLAYMFGWGMYIVPFFIGGVGLWLILRRFEDRIPVPEPQQGVGLVLGFFVALTMMHTIVHFIWPEVSLYALGEDGVGGGVTGALLLDLGIRAVGRTGVIILLLMGWMVVITLTWNISPVEAIRRLMRARRRVPQATGAAADEQLSLPDINAPVAPPPDEPPAEPVIIGGTDKDAAPEKKARRRRKAQDEEPEIHVAGRPGNGQVDIEIGATGSQAWRLPVVTEILQEGSEQFFSEELIRKQSRIIEETLVSLGAPVRVQEINNGPVVTQFGVEPLFLTNRSGKKTKVKVSKVANLADDLALALSARTIRIQAPIPGKGLVGIEVPNEQSSVVSLLDVMQSESFAKKHKGRLRLGLGQDVSGQAIAADLRKMPHLLIAGATGSGKSVCVNAIVAALLLQNSPDTLRLLMVDPKRVELTQYNGIPHLLVPVIVDVDRVVPALRWVMREMDSRYRRFAQIGARNIEDFNQKAAKSAEESPIPYIAVLVDELADLMMQSPEETERVICRLAQMARATGIHLIIATQRPSVDVVTGLIKANFPARIAFAVASSIDSRVILDMPGAERLLGRGDMLFMPPDVSQPMRLQGAFVSDRELDRLIDYWRKRKAVEPDRAPEPVHIPQVTTTRSTEQPALFPDFESETNGAGEFEDDLLPSAVEIFLAENRASISLLQRRLRIGYTRSARLVETLTDMGIVMLEKEGQFRKVNRAVGEALLQSLNPEGEEPTTL